jgi:hypothetical protein
MSTTTATPETATDVALALDELRAQLYVGSISARAWVYRNEAATGRDLAAMAYGWDGNPDTPEGRALALSINRTDRTSAWRAAWVRDRMADGDMGAPLTDDEVRQIARQKLGAPPRAPPPPRPRSRTTDPHPGAPLDTSGAPPP